MVVLRRFLRCRCDYMGSAGRRTGIQTVNSRSNSRSKCMSADGKWPETALDGFGQRDMREGSSLCING